MHDWLRSIGLWRQYWVLLRLRLIYKDSVSEVRILGWVAKLIGLWLHHHSVVRRTVHVNVVANVKSLCAARGVEWHTTGHHIVSKDVRMHVGLLHIFLRAKATFSSPLICSRIISVLPSVSIVFWLKLLLSGLWLVIWFIDTLNILCLDSIPVVRLPSLLIIIKSFLTRFLHPAFHVSFLLTTFFRRVTGSLTSTLSELAIDIRLLQDWVLLQKSTVNFVAEISWRSEPSHVRL